MTKIIRTHDAFYLNENRYRDPKQLHLEIIDRIKKIENNKGKVSPETILDAGCAAGEFAFALQNAFPNSKVRGFDLLPELIAKAKNEADKCFFYEANILDGESAEANSADVVTCTGVLSIFDTFEPSIQNLLAWCKPGGTIFVHSLFNSFPYDVRIQYNASESYGSGILESGWNIISKDSVSKFLNELKEIKVIDAYTFQDFKMKKALKVQDDLIRSWTQSDIDGNLQITNGLMLLQPHAILEIRKSL